jgi:hypothetical protein
MATPTFCSACGQALKEGARFCANCGSVVVAKAAPAQSPVGVSPAPAKAILTPQTPNAPPQFSPDGKWWWNGKQWVAANQPALPEVAAIKVSRKSTFSGSAAGMDVVIDGKVVWKLGNGEEIASQVAPGEHSIRVQGHGRFGFRPSPTLRVRLEAGRQAHFTCYPAGMAGGIQLKPMPGTGVLV